MSDDFDNILDRAGSEVSDDVVLYPSGTYILRCASVAFGSYTNKDNEEVATASLGYAVGSPTDDVDQDEYQSVADAIRGQRVWKRFTLDNSKNVAGFKKAIRAHGINPDDASEFPTLRDAAKACKNTEVLGYIGIKTYKNKAEELIRDNEVKSVAPVSDMGEAA